MFAAQLLQTLVIRLSGKNAPQDLYILAVYCYVCKPRDDVLQLLRMRTDPCFSPRHVDVAMVMSSCEVDEECPRGAS